MKKNILLIWDFDGVLADSEHLWVQNWTDVLAQMCHIYLSQEQQKYYLEGKSDKTKIPLLQADFPQAVFDENFMQCIKLSEDRLIAEKLTLTPHVTDILEDNDFTHCVATGANLEKHTKKTLFLGLDKYFNPSNTFTAYDVPLGKPEPDLFLYAAKKMNFEPQNCIVIEDSPVGIQAGKAAKMHTIAFVGATNHNTTKYITQCRKLGADFISASMPEIHNYIKTRL